MQFKNILSVFYLGFFLFVSLSAIAGPQNLKIFKALRKTHTCELFSAYLCEFLKRNQEQLVHSNVEFTANNIYQHIFPIFSDTTLNPTEYEQNFIKMMQHIFPQIPESVLTNFITTYPDFVLESSFFKNDEKKEKNENEEQKNMANIDDISMLEVLPLETLSQIIDLLSLEDQLSLGLVSRSLSKVIKFYTQKVVKKMIRHDKICLVGLSHPELTVSFRLLFCHMPMEQIRNLKISNSYLSSLRLQKILKDFRNLSILEIKDISYEMTNSDHHQVNFAITDSLSKLKTIKFAKIFKAANIRVLPSLQSYKTSFSKLEEMHFSNHCMTPEFFVQLVEKMNAGEMNKLKKINFSCHEFSPKLMENFMLVLVHDRLKELVSLDLHETSLTDENVKLLCQFPHLQSLIVLNLGTNHIGSNGINELTKAAKSRKLENLEELNLESNEMTADSMSNFFSEVEGNKLPHLKVVKIGYTRSDARAILSCVRSMRAGGLKQLSALSFPQTSISPISIVNFFKELLLVPQTNLKKIDFSHHSLGNSPLSVFYQFLIDSPHAERFESLKLTNTGHDNFRLQSLIQAIQNKKLKNLKKLHVDVFASQQSEGDFFLQLLAQGYMPKLESIFLTSNFQIGQSVSLFFQALANGKFLNLKKFQVTNSRLNEENFVILMKAIQGKALWNVKVFEFGHFQLNSKMNNKLLDSLSEGYMPKLRRLNLKNVNLDLHGIQLVKYIIEHEKLPRLRELILPAGHFRHEIHDTIKKANLEGKLLYLTPL